MTIISGELTTKLATLRAALGETQAVAVRLRGVDWFAWATCGGSNVVILTTETGIAEVFVTMDGAWILTDQIEGGRLATEEVPPGFETGAGAGKHPRPPKKFEKKPGRGRRDKGPPPTGRGAPPAPR